MSIPSLVINTVSLGYTGKCAKAINPFSTSPTFRVCESFVRSEGKRGYALSYFIER